ncbi:vacuolar protein sorting-associated protein 17 [[Candida] railenensis]|uniref:Vacuolar protein sorting-associated protein 17 n=1 Tax=[Candida] railenensis TaxID=45579 RepID=A0A9P0QTH7_9ASCO|nr:vacuolar protein sorting-associated protein 17 [[Candida] railenensis]
MSSAVPYNPEDFDDNNPFAEPDMFPADEEDNNPNNEDHAVSHSQTGQAGQQQHYESQHPQVPTQVQTQEHRSVLNERETSALSYNNNTHAGHQTDRGEDQEEGDNVAETDNSNSAQLTEKELRKLIPERFTKKYSLTIKLRGIEPNKSGNPILNFDVQVAGLARFRQSTYKEVRRTFNEVLKFNKYLSVSNLEVCVPVIPSALTSYPSGGVEETKHLMIEWQEWFDRISSNPILIRDEEFIFFVENDFGYSVINSNRKTAIASGLLRKTLKQFQVPYDPYEELADFRPLIKSSYLICTKLHKALDRKSKSEKQISVYIGELSQKLIQLSEFEMIHPGMKNMWEKLSKISSIQSDLVLIESINDMGNFGDGIQSMIDDFYQIKEALTNRHLIMRELSTAEKDTKSKHLQANKIKNKSSLDPLKVDEALRSLEYASKTEESLNLQLKRISGEMLFEKQEIINHTEVKFRRMLRNFTLNKVEHHRKILKHLENIRLDIRIVDERGGLSRLNRENLSNLKHNLTQSQSVNGDSWSHRTFRSLNAKTSAEEELKEEGEGEIAVDAKNAASILGVATF